MTTYIVRTANYYGSGATVDKAKAACVAAGGGTNIKKFGFVCHRVTGDWAIHPIDGTLTATGEIEQTADARKRR